MDFQSKKLVLQTISGNKVDVAVAATYNICANRTFVTLRFKDLNCIHPTRRILIIEFADLSCRHPTRKVLIVIASRSLSSQTSTVDIQPGRF